LERDGRPCPLWKVVLLLPPPPYQAGIMKDIVVLRIAPGKEPKIEIYVHKRVR
jgi:hypothetical protein